MPKGNSGIKKNGSVLKQVEQRMRIDSKRGVISLNITKGLKRESANAVYELLDKNYPMLEGYRFEDLGIGGYNYYRRNSEGAWSRVNGWHELYPETLTTESAKRGFVKLQIYGDAGKVER